MKLARWVVAMGSVAVLLAGCGGGGETETVAEGSKRPPKLQQVSVTIDGLPGPESAGLFMAEKRGYFTDAGLEVVLMAPSHPPRPLWYTANRTVDLAVSHEPQVDLSRRNGAPVVAVGSLLPESTMAMIWLEKSGIEGISDLEGKTVAYPGVRFQEKLLETALAKSGLTLADVKLERVDYELVPALVSGRADAIFGGSWNVEGVELESRGLKLVVSRVSELGAPAYDELVVIGRKDRVSEEPEMFRRFLAAAYRGAEAAREDPDAATDAIAQYASEYGTVNRRALRTGVEATVPLLSTEGPSDSGGPLG